MKLGILGTGHVAKTLSAAWSQTHEIRLGSRDPGKQGPETARSRRLIAAEAGVNCQPV
jgi:predicted dinucleotide-binding enzyme